MTKEEFIALMDMNGYRSLAEREYLKFDRVVEREFPTERPDLYAFLLLDKLLPGKSDIVKGAEHDQLWLDTDVDELARVITLEQAVTLLRCGISYDDDVDRLYS